MDASSRTASRAAAVSILVAGTFATLKIVIGLSAHSVAVVSDGLESAGDLVTSFLVWLGLWVASKPADADHPYGHGRFETLTGLAVGIVVSVLTDVPFAPEIGLLLGLLIGWGLTGRTRMGE